MELRWGLNCTPDYTTASNINYQNYIPPKQMIHHSLNPSHARLVMVYSWGYITRRETKFSHTLCGAGVEESLFFPPLTFETCFYKHWVQKQPKPETAFKASIFFYFLFLSLQLFSFTCSHILAAGGNFFFINHLWRINKKKQKVNRQSPLATRSAEHGKELDCFQLHCTVEKKTKQKRNKMKPKWTKKTRIHRIT